jgi:hypothetical protein
MNLKDTASSGRAIWNLGVFRREFPALRPLPTRHLDKPKRPDPTHPAESTIKGAFRGKVYWNSPVSKCFFEFQKKIHPNLVSIVHSSRMASSIGWDVGRVAACPPAIHGNSIDMRRIAEQELNSSTVETNAGTMAGTVGEWRGVLDPRTAVSSFPKLLAGRRP